MQMADLLEKSLMLGKIEGRKRRSHQRMRWLDNVTEAMAMNLGKLREMVGDRQAWRAAVHEPEHDWATEQPQHKWKVIFKLYTNVSFNF